MASSKGQAWFCTTGLPSDVDVEVGDMTFHLHKFPLMSKSKRLHELITEQETNPTRVQRSSAAEGNGGKEEIHEEEEEEVDTYCHISLPEFPGGAEAFETAAKFCYGVKMELSSSNVAPLRCAGEVLEMTEEYSVDNLISRAERFLSQKVFKSIKDSIKTLKSCERLMPLAENLGIVQRCIDSITARASSADPSLFGWPVNDTAGNGRTTTNRSETSGRRKSTGRANDAGSWFDELAVLSLPLLKRLIFEMKTHDLSPEIIENCLICYAKRYIPGISRSNRKPLSSSIPSENEQRELLETIIANLPVEKSSRSSTTATRYLFGLLRNASILNASEACRTKLERKLGSQLEQATLDDLLIPSYSYLNETLYDVDCVERILSYFLDSMEQKSTERIDGEEENSGDRSATLILVGKLIDGYLSEIASDSNLKTEKFYGLAVALPEHARLYDDGLYRAVDVYLKAHPRISSEEREKISCVMDCEKLTLDACTHAAQNERLPLRPLVQVLFFEQLHLRQAVAGTLLAAEAPLLDPRREEEREPSDAGVAAAGEAQSSGITWRAAVRENQVLRLDVDSMRSRVHELERACSSMKKAIEKLGLGPAGGWKSSLARRFGCKFKTQVCDSHEPTVMEARKRRNHPRR